MALAPWPGPLWTKPRAKGGPWRHFNVVNHWPLGALGPRGYISKPGPPVHRKMPQYKWALLLWGVNLSIRTSGPLCGQRPSPLFPPFFGRTRRLKKLSSWAKMSFFPQGGILAPSYSWGGGRPFSPVYHIFSSSVLYLGTYSPRVF